MAAAAADADASEDANGGAAGVLCLTSNVVLLAASQVLHG